MQPKKRSMRAVTLVSLILIFINALTCIQATQINQFHRVLILTDPKPNNKKLAKSIQNLLNTQQIYQTLVANADANTISLSEYGEYLYDTLILANPQTSFPKTDAKHGDASTNGINNQLIAKFVDDGGNLLIVTHQDAPNHIRKLTNLMGMDFAKNESKIINRFNNQNQDDKNYLKFNLNPSSALHSPYDTDEYTFNHTINLIPIRFFNSNHLLTPLIVAPPTAYVQPRLNEQSLGTKLVIVGGLQTVDGRARVAVTSAAELFEHPDEEDNRLGRLLLHWVTNQARVVRAGAMVHHRVGETEAPRMYKDGDLIDLSVHVEEQLSPGLWVPYRGEVQFSAIMQYPKMRFLLDRRDGGVFGKEFVLPDVYGIYKFELYAGGSLVGGYNDLKVSEQVTLRNYRLSDHPSFVFGGYPYYFSHFVAVASTVLFAVLFLWTREDEKKDVLVPVQKKDDPRLTVKKIE